MNKTYEQLSTPKNYYQYRSCTSSGLGLMKRGELQKLSQKDVSKDGSIESDSSEDEAIKLEGFSNQTWKDNALNIIVLIAKFITYVLTSSDKFKLRFLELKQFRVINDTAADYDYYIEQNLIRQRSKQTILSKIKAKFTKLQHNFQDIGLRIRPIRPDNGWKLLWDVFVFSILLINIVYIPMKISFEIVNIPDGADLFLDALPQYVFIAEILLNFNVAFYSKGVLILNQNHIIKHYLKGKFILDCIVLIPFMIGRSNIPYVEFVLLFRVSRVISIFESLVEAWNLRLKFAAMIDIISLLSFFLFTSHLIACMWHFIALSESSYTKNPTWVDIKDLQDEDWLSRYLTSFYWACITTLTIGYGDIIPNTNIEKLFVIFVALCSSIIFGYTISNIGAIFAQMSENKRVLRDKMTMIDAFVKKRGLNKALQVKVKKFFEYFLQMESDNEAECEKLMEHLSTSLNREVKIEFYKEIIKKSKLLRQTFSDKFIENLCLLIKEQSFVPEETLFAEGQKVDRIYFILKGEVEAYLGARTIKVYNRHTVINDKTFLSQKPARFSIKALKFSKVAYLTFDEFQNLLDLSPEDKERYFQVKHLIDFGGRVKFSGCELCNQSHDFIKCPFVFYTPNPARNIEQKRQPYTRGDGSPNTLLYLAQLQRAVLYYGNATGLYGEMTPTDQFFMNNKRGRTILYSQYQDDKDSESDSFKDYAQLKRSISSKLQGTLKMLPQQQLIATHHTPKNSNGRKATLLQQIKMQKSVKIVEEEFSGSETTSDNLDINQVKWVEIEYAKMVGSTEYNVDKQYDLNFYDVNFNFESVLKSIQLNKSKKKKFMIKKKRPRIRKSGTQLQSISIKNSQFS